jgi:hypothetical protein
MWADLIDLVQDLAPNLGELPLTFFLRGLLRTTLLRAELVDALGLDADLDGTAALEGSPATLALRSFAEP